MTAEIQPGYVLFLLLGYTKPRSPLQQTDDKKKFPLAHLAARRHSELIRAGKRRLSSPGVKRPGHVPIVVDGNLFGGCMGVGGWAGGEEDRVH